MPNCLTPACPFPTKKKGKKCYNCTRGISSWQKRDPDEALEYQRKLMVRTDRMSHVVTKTEVMHHAVEVRRRTLAEIAAELAATRRGRRGRKK